MTRRRSSLLALLLLLQVVFAPSICLARIAAPVGFDLIICTADGLRTLHGTAAPDAGRDGEPNGGPHARAHTEPCLACHALPATPATEPPVLATPAWAGRPVTWAPPRPAAPPPAIRGPPSGARAPPNPV